MQLLGGGGGGLDLFAVYQPFTDSKNKTNKRQTKSEDLSRRLDERKATELLILVFRKAFDPVAHRRLLHKIQHYGITGRTNTWIKSWLCHRQQKVVLDGPASKRLVITHTYVSSCHQTIPGNTTSVTLQAKLTEYPIFSDGIYMAATRT